MRLFLTVLLILTGWGVLSAQKVLQIETFGSPKTKKIMIGESLIYQVADDEFWYQGTIRDYLVPQNVIAFDDRYLALDKITAFRYERRWPYSLRNQLFYFGLAWSGYAVIGTLTDNNPDTNYRWSDAVVTAGAAGVGFSLPLLFSTKEVRFGKRKRLRLLDLNFE